MDLTLCSGWPYGGPHIPITQAAGRLRVDRVPVLANATEVKAPRIAEGEKLFAVFVGSGAELPAAVHDDRGDPIHRRRRSSQTAPRSSSSPAARA